MSDSSLSNVNKWLVSQGFKHVAKETNCFTYDGLLRCNNIDVPVRFSFLDLSFQDIPDIHILEPRHESLKRPLPHVDCNGKICYLDAESYRVDPYQPEQTIATLLEQARQVLNDSLTGANNDDVGYEFSSYWEPVGYGVVISTNNSGVISKYNRLEYIGRTKEKRNIVVVGNDNEIENHRLLVGGTLRYKNNNCAIWITVSEQSLLPYNKSWPPENFHDLFTWLKSVDVTASKTLGKLLGSKAGAGSPLLIIFNTSGGITAVEVILPINLCIELKSPGKFRKFLLADKGMYSTKFFRVNLNDFSPKFQTTRNILGNGLSKKHIVLVGCGTVGGYLSRLLVQSGAGQNGGTLHLYDGQSFSPGNVGRHYLDGAYLYDNKAEACGHKLLTEFPSANVISVKKDFTGIGKFTRADIIIDATGREPFSLGINKQIIHKYRKKESCPPVIYAWVDGNGCCGRTLYYDGSGGCYRCLQDMYGQERFKPLKSTEDLVPMHFQCGESFIPYPPSVSVQTAGLVLEAVLDWVNGKIGHTFRSREFSTTARNCNDQKLTHVTGCPACQK